MSRPFTPGGRFDTDFEIKDIHKGITADLTNPVGTSVLWYVWDSVATIVDPIYDVADSGGTGRRWKSPVTIPVVRAIISQGSVMLTQRGFYNADKLHLTIDRNELLDRIPTLLSEPDPLNKDRLVWRGQVYRPYSAQQQGIVDGKFTLLTFDCQQVMPEEMVNDSQFQSYAQA